MCDQNCQPESQIFLDIQENPSENENNDEDPHETTQAAKSDQANQSKESNNAAEYDRLKKKKGIRKHAYKNE